MPTDDDDERKPSVLLRIVVGIIRSTVTTLRIVFAPSIAAYHLWSGLINLSITVVLSVSTNNVLDSFCIMPIAPGDCDKCSDRILLCDRPSCIQQSTNITYHQKAKDSKQHYYEDFMRAVADADCMDVVGRSRSPVSIIHNIYLKQLDPINPVTVSQSCSNYHCMSLRRALTEISDVNSPTGTECTNNFLTKPQNRSTECTCNGLTQELESDPLLITSVQDVCFQVLIDEYCAFLAGGSRYASFCASTTSTLAPLARNTSNTSGRRLQPPCDSLDHGLASSSLSQGQPDRAGHADLALLPHGISAEQPPCDSLDHGLVPLSLSQLQPASAGNADLAFAPHSISAELVLSGSGPMRALQTQSSSISTVPPHAIAAELVLPGSAPVRALQTQSSSVGAGTDGTTEWTVGDWTTCKCYQVCVAGLQTRMVTCGAAACKGAAPASERPCVCNHCANCEAVPILQIMPYVGLFQIVANMCLFCCFQLFSNLPEEEMIRIGIVRKFIGLFPKRLPFLVNFCTVLELGVVLYLIMITFVAQLLPADTVWMKDCFRSTQLRLCCYLIAGHWLFRVLIGQLALRLTRHPPWLYMPRSRSRGVLKKIPQIIQSMGPS
eukprot:TRINITY_DN7684_c0_g1_i1.p1 TRINITY_DN7684_c0_g1~~TRINITY_DN7684_c0_g1_i1.p1  ORF type:complete len:617 (-),score=62.69 TRINITY_DN7684_c0_g1_i1:15-1835(-)